MKRKNQFNLLKIKKFFPNLNSRSFNFKNLNSEILLKLSKFKLIKKKNFYFKEFGKLIFPFYDMGNIKSIDLFSANEFIIFYFYFKYKAKYLNVADFGANLGLHTIILSKCGYKVTSYEPDPIIFKKLRNNIRLNKCKNIKIINSAIYNKDAVLKFTRVKNNLTGSHISKEKKSYGEKEYIKVKTVNIKKIVNKYDLIKIDIESAEATVLCSLLKKDYLHTDFIVEVGNKKNSKKIFNFLNEKKLKFYSQKNNFKIINRLDQMPFSHRDGTLIISQKIVF